MVIARNESVSPLLDFSLSPSNIFLINSKLPSCGDVQV